MTLTACYAVANEADVIADSLRSVKGFVDRFVIVDSVFPANAIDATHSTDDTREVCERICSPVPLTYIESDRKLRQDQARNRYLDELAVGDWCLNLDGDEVAYGDYTQLRQLFSWLQFGSDGVRALNIPVLSAGVMFNGMAREVTEEHYATAPIVHSLGYAPRLFRKTATMEYRSTRYGDVVDPMGLWEGDEPLGDLAMRDTRLLIVNQHTRQSYSGYQHDAFWQELEMHPAVPA